MKPFDRRKPRETAARPMKFGEIRPDGWLHRQIWNDLEHGFAGRDGAKPHVKEKSA